MNEALIKAKKNCSTTAKVLNIIGIALCIGSIICAVFMALSYILFGMAKTDKLPEEFTTVYAEGVNNGYITFDDNGEIFGIDIDDGTDMSDPAIGFLTIAIYTTVGFIVLLLTGIAISNMGKIFKEMAECDSPFSSNIAKRAKKIFILLLVVVLLGSGSLLAAFIFALCFWCFYSIFLYGRTLQDQVDETL